MVAMQKGASNPDPNVTVKGIEVKRQLSLCSMVSQYYNTEKSSSSVLITDEEQQLCLEKEKQNITKMNQLFIALLHQIDTFQFNKHGFDDLNDKVETEILMQNRLIKKEVIEMADMVEEMQNQISC